uniref:Uncharacterized protein n=1 Tax=Cacopsylla melanoneura TaxID=428564 RepID=A0A8D8RFJ6_9HEMI
MVQHMALLTVFLALSPISSFFIFFYILIVILLLSICLPASLLHILVFLFNYFLYPAFLFPVFSPTCLLLFNTRYLRLPFFLFPCVMVIYNSSLISVSLMQ